ncbi:Pyrimidine reductase, riboflavin biosynthesis [Frankia canadensis]|uniref:Pyrimidine reductase, riboflavin biosynthesis n=1 Tax=Frankia canadensis TaxID=1836972 RepID=A0A2I2KVK1_9ACTN|nr:dihydrofolate reductase family protein [Frankia canadensis]SNQ49678.1 Pyrimidine reductase, riboflavin biosynthesis [Frankia canadensis]SOU56968.1 Pyrimidine reductase, riboflavin biosynthesis [Frankia canadensis]
MLRAVDPRLRAAVRTPAVAERPYVLCSCAMSLDGRIDDCSDERLMLSGPADLDRVDEVRAGCDAILVGAATVRRDDPRLVVRAEHRRAARVAAGRPPTPLRVVLSGAADLDPAARLFTADPGEVLLYRHAVGGPAESPWAGRGAVATAGGRASVTVVDLPARPRLAVADVLADLARRGVRRLLVEGGTSVHTAFLTAGVVDELHLVVAPFFVGVAEAPTFVAPGDYPQGVRAPLRLAEVRQLDDVVLLRYLLAESGT